MIKIGILSDTHCTFDDPLKRFFAEVDELWHAGDIGSYECAREIAAFKPLLAVHGNCDDHLVRFEYKKFNSFDCEGIRVLITHIGYDPQAKLNLTQINPTIFVCGHTHILKVHNYNGILCINPGAAGIGRQIVRTAIRLTIDGEKIDNLEVLEI